MVRTADGIKKSTRKCERISFYLKVLYFFTHCLFSLVKGCTYGCMSHVYLLVHESCVLMNAWVTVSLLAASRLVDHFLKGNDSEQDSPKTAAVEDDVDVVMESTPFRSGQYFSYCQTAISYCTRYSLVLSGLMHFICWLLHSFIIMFCNTFL